MQLKQVIIDTFSRKGYFQTSPITKRQFHILMNTFLSQTSSNPHWLFNQSLTNQIWKQSQQKIINNNHKQSKQSTSLNVQIVILTIVDAIQILTNRILQCQQRVEQLIKKRQSYQLQHNFIKLQPLQQKIDSLKNDLEQFQKDFKMLTQPFLSDGNKYQLRKQFSIKRKQTIKNNHTINTNNNNNQDFQSFSQHIHNRFDSRTIQQTPHDQKNKSTYKQQKNCAIYFLVFLAILELSVCLIKFSFLNLIIFLIAFLVLVQDKFLPSMIKIVFWACLISIFMDAGWLVLYSNSYLHSYFNSGLKHQLKPYFQYIWFVTGLQAILKIFFVIFIKLYEIKFMVEQKQKSEQNRIQDSYIPQAREQIKQITKSPQKNKGSNKKKKFGSPEDDQLTIN